MASKHVKKAIQRQVIHNKINIPHKQVAEPKEDLKQISSMNLKLAFLLGFISLVVYGNTLKNGFVLDDTSVITENTFVTKGISAVPTLLTTPHMRGFFITSHDIYRPLSLVMFAIEYEFFGKQPMPYHLINILLFAGCVIMLFLFLDKLFKRKKTEVSFIASLLFALHPIHTEVVANIKSRDELLCFFFAFLCLNVFVKYMKSGKVSLLVSGAFCFFLSLLSKETVVTFLAVIPLVFFFYRNENKSRSKYITLATVAVVVVFLVMKFTVLSYYHANETTEINFIDNALAKKDLPSDSRIATALLILGYYIKLLFVPYPLVSDYSYNSIPYVTFANFKVLVSFALYTFLAVFSIRLLLKDNKNPFAFSILFFLITISLFTNIIFLFGSTLGERLLFFPSAGFCLLLALLLEKWVGTTSQITFMMLKNPKVLGVMIPVLVFYSIITAGRNSEWSDNYILYKTDLKKSPNSSKLNYNLGHEMSINVYGAEPDTAKKRQIINESISYLKRAIALYPDYADAQTELGATYFGQAQYDSAEVYEKKVVALNPTNTLAINNLAAVYFIKRRYPEAIALFKRAITIRPDFLDPYSNIGLCYQYTRRYDSAIYYLHKGIEINPDYKKIYEILATTYKLAGDFDQAKKYEAIVKKDKPAFKL